MGHPPDLGESIKGLYQTFSVYPLPESTEPCPCCHALDDDARLLSKPLRELDLEDLHMYMQDALLTWGGVPEFKYFLPRVFDLTATLQRGVPDPEIVLSGLRYGYWRVWPSEEQTAVEAFLHALWGQVLTHPSPPLASRDVECWLCAVAQAEDDMTPYLNQWMEDERLSASMALAWLILGGVGANPFWDGRGRQYAQLEDWLKLPAVRQKLQHAHDKAVETGSTEDLVLALRMLNA